MAKMGTLGWIVIALIALAVVSPGMLSSLNLGAATGTGNAVVPSTGTSTVSATYRNTDNSTLYYLAATVVYAQDGRQITSETLTGGLTKSVSTGKSLNFGQSYDAYVLSSSVTNSKKFTFVADSPTKALDLEGTAASQAEFQLLTTSLGNLTVGDGTAGSFGQDETALTTTTLGAGETTTRIIRYRAKTSNAQFGSEDTALPAYVCAYFPLSKFNLGDVVVDRSDWTPVSMPKYCADNGYLKAWQIPAVRSASGEQDVKTTIKAYADPGAGNDVKFMFVDSAYYTSASGQIVAGSIDDAGSDVGSTNRYVTVDMS
jgi:hypothetical protein